MIVAGEASGDLHGGDLAREILARDPSCDLFGIAGEKMRAAGVRAIIKTEDIHGLGLSELASTIGRTVGAFRRCVGSSEREPDLLILIDYASQPDSFGHRAAQSNAGALLHHAASVGMAARPSRQAGRPRGPPRGGAAVRGRTFSSRGRSGFVRRASAARSDRHDPEPGETLKSHGFPPRARIISILPGSRRAEVRYLLAPMVKAARIVARDHNLEIALALAPTLTRAELAEVARADLAESRSSTTIPTILSRRASSRSSRLDRNARDRAARMSRSHRL